MIRYLENNEKQNIRPLYEHCFDDTKEYTDYYFQNRLPGNHVIVNERDNKIVNCVHLIPNTWKTKDKHYLYIWCWYL